ncbi:putative heme-dependent peroxidase [Vulcanimicrobium alpinum]|uniref:Coproheme decarboxylase n=1 Tax=Vulcanimicrobium alpinum TaxID=3016050 RepID=A0AAN2C970_UNVUL|nr:hydrogen peroxide-dependent heme synthase [Vulcanimicrobium alpinum]BDE05277.1 putative heme-dependent peroxidase [Vulcanimicrobium alpinum]
MRHPNVPESLDGWAILHRMFRLDRRRWDALDAPRRDAVEREAGALFGALARDADADLGLAQLLGHKGDLMLTHYARAFDALGDVQAQVDKLALRDFIEPLESYVSILELGLYEHTAKIHAELRDRGLKAHSDAWNAAFDELLADAEREPRNAGRLWARIPHRRYVCFYPMNKKRDGADNWYNTPYDERAKLMLEHGKIGRSFHGHVTQVISGSIGFDDWEWGVDLYADDPLVFKKLVYTMRFDEASSRFGEFGRFWTGMQFSVAQLGVFLAGTASPALLAEDVAEPALR